MPDEIYLLKQEITSLKGRLDELEGRFPRTMAGPIGNWLQAAQIGPGPVATSAMHMNLMGNQVGVAPRVTVTDASGIVRFEFGNLAANGASPAMFGQRTNFTDGSAISDSLGFLATASQAATVSTTGIGTMGPYATVADRAITSATTGNFTLTRSTWCLVVGTVAGSSSDTAGILTASANVFVQVSGQTASAHLAIPIYLSTNPNQAFGSATPLIIQQIPAGTYSAALYWNNLVATQTLTFADRAVTVYKLGG